VWKNWKLGASNLFLDERKIKYPFLYLEINRKLKIKAKG